MEILCSFRLVLEGKTGKEIPESSRFEFLEKFLANNFALSDAEDNTSGPLNRGGIADLPLLRTLLAIRQKSREPSFWEVMDSFVLVAYASLAVSRTLLQRLLTITSLNNYAPIKIKPKTNTTLIDKPWITHAIRKSVKTKNRLYKQFYTEKDQLIKETIFEYFKTYRNHLVTIIRMSKEDYFKKYFDDNKKDTKKEFGLQSDP